MAKSATAAKKSDFLIGQKDCLAIAEQALALSKADQTEVMVMREDSYLTRYANSVIHQNTAIQNASISVRAIISKRQGSASTNRLDDEGIRRAVQTAADIARQQPEDPEFTTLPGPAKYEAVQAYSERTASLSPADRAAVVGEMVTLAKERGCTLAGAYASGQTELVIANSLGVRGYLPSAQASLRVVAVADASTGFAQWTGTDIGKLDHEAVARRAVGKAVTGRKQQRLDPGDYVVVLEDPAVADLVGMLGWMGLGALSLQEGRSFMTDRLGEKLTSEQITLRDDGFDSRGAPMPFDFEGVPKQRLPLIEKGVARGVVYDTATAAKDGKPSTGHALPAPNPWGPMPLNLFLDGGDASLDDLIAGTPRGLLVTRFWYTNVVHPRKTVITGLTRDGTFLIERGEVVSGVRNFRFTQSIIDAFASTERVGRDLALSGNWRGGACVPALRVGRFAMTSVAQEGAPLAAPA